MTIEKTADALLDAAEALFARNGIPHTSIREITKKARANLASVHYHFGSKDALVRAVLVRRAGELNGARLKLLDDAETASGKRPLPIETIMHAFIQPTGRFCTSHPDFMRVIGRVFSDPDDKLRMFWMSQFREILQRFPAAISRSLPELPPEEIFWRMIYVVGAMIFTWTNQGDAPKMSGGRVSPQSEGEMVERLVTLSIATFRAPVPVKGASA